MTRNDLLVRAAALALSFNKSATKAEIESAISVREMEIAANAPSTIDADTLKTIKRKKPSTHVRGDDGKIVRKGYNLSGNTPYRAKLYFIDPIVYAQTVDARSAAPNQVKIIMKTMVEHGFTSVDKAVRGVTVVDTAKADGMATKIDSDRLFAYYRRLMENLGLVFIGNAKTSAGEDVVVDDEDESEAA